MRARTQNLSRPALSLLAVAIAFSSSAHAAGFTWNGQGGNNNWSTGENWIGGLAPDSGTATTLLFTNAPRAISIIDFPWTLRSITFASDVGLYDISGETITLAGGGSITNNSPYLQAFANSGFILNGASTWTPASGSLSVSGVISGTGSITKTGAATLFLTGANSYTGGTTISGGTLEFAAGSLGSGPITVNNARLRWAAGNSDGLSGTLTIGSGVGALNTNGNDIGLNASLSASSILFKEGEGTLTLNAPGTTAGITVNGGTLKLGVANAISSGNTLIVNATGGYGSAATLDLNGHNLTASSLTFGSTSTSQAAAVNTLSTGSGTLTVTGNISYRVVSDNTDFHSGGAVLNGNLNLGNAVRTISVSDSVNTGAELTISANITSGAGSGITKTGLGTLVLSGTNTYTGNTIISDGALRVGNSSNLPASTNVQLNGGVLELAYDRVLTYGTGAGQIRWTNSGGFSAWGGDRTLNYEGGAALTWGASNFVANNRVLYFASESSDSMLTMPNNINLNGGTRTIDVSYGTSAGTDATLSGVLSNGSLTKTGWGVLRLTGANTYTGATTISSGYLLFGNRASLYNADTSRWTASNLRVSGGAVFSVGGAGEFTAADIDMLKSLGSSTQGFRNGSTLGFDTTNAAGGNFTYSSAIGNTNGGANSIGIDKFGSGTLTLSAANTYTGITSAWIGTLEATNAGSLGSGSNVWEDGTYVIDGGSLLLNNVAIGNERITMYGNGVGGNGALRSKGASSLAGDVELHGDSSLNVEDGSLTLTGAVTGYTLTKIGDGTLIFGGNTGNNSAIQVSNGTLVLAKDSGPAIANSLEIHDGAVARVAGDDQIGEYGSALVRSGGTLDLNGHNEGFSRLGGSGLVTNSATGASVILTVGENDGYSSFAGVLEDGAGTLALVKTGWDWLDLSGANTYSGGTTLDSGGLAIGHAGALGSGPLIINAGHLRNASGGDLTLDDIAVTVNGDFIFSGNNLNLGAVTLTGNRVIQVDENTLAIGGVIGDGGNGYSITKAGGWRLALNAANTYSGGTNLNDGTLALGHTGALGDAGTIALNGGILQFSTANTNDYSARFSTEPAQQYRIDTNGQSVTFSSALTSPGGRLEKLGEGILTLSGANSYDGNTDIVAGTLVVTNDSALGNGGGENWTNVSEGATLHLDNVDIGDEWIVASGSGVGGNGALVATGTSSSSGQVNFYNASVNVAGALSFTGAVFDNFVKEGAGVLTLGGATDNSGLIGTVNAGLLVLAKDSAPDVHAIGYGITVRNGGTVRLAGTGGDQIYNEGNVQLDEGGTLDLNGRTESFAALTGAGIVTNTAAATTATLEVGEWGADSTFDGTLQDGAGTLALSKTGSGNFTLTGANTFSGGTILREGVLTLGSAGAIGSEGEIAFRGGTLRFSEANATDYSGRFSTEASQQYRIDTNGQSVTFSGALTSSDGRIEKLGTGSLTLSGTTDNTGLVGAVVNAGLLILAKDSAPDVHAIGYELTIRDGAAVRIAGTGGDQIYNEANVQIDGGGTLDLNGRAEGINALTGSGVVTNSAAATVATLTVGEFGAGSTFDGTLQDDAGTLALVKAGGGYFTLTGENTFTGGTILEQGFLTLGSAGAIGSEGEITFRGGVLRFSEANTTDYSGRFSTEAGQTYKFDTNGQVVTLAGNFSGEGSSFQKHGSGTVILTGTNDYEGITLIEGGVLIVLGDNSDTGETIVEIGGTLGGTGSTGDVLVQLGGTLAPGASPGLLTIEGDLTMVGGATLLMEFSGTGIGEFDQIAVQDFFTAGGILSLQLIDGFDPVEGDSFLLFTMSGIDAGYFDSIQTNLGNGLSWDISQLGSTGIVTVVPEPSVATLTVLGLSGLLLRSRNRRRSAVRQSF